jgi:murein DD-endopeptidase MepM/ murein hydrolase activator NlpD
VARGDPARAASPLGNYVRVRSGAHELCFAHLARGSVAVAAGRSVGAGEILGKIGDSGRSAEPHLHVHVTTVDGVPHGVPIRFRVSGELWEPLRGAVVEQTRI